MCHVLTRGSVDRESMQPQLRVYSESSCAQSLRPSPCRTSHPIVQIDDTDFRDVTMPATARRVLIELMRLTTSDN